MDLVDREGGLILDKILVIGASGLLGGHLAKYAKDRYDVVATYLGHPFDIPGCKAIKMDITDPERTINAVQKEGPDCVVLSAAQRNVDYCEKNQDEVRRINVEGARNVAIAANAVQAKLIFLSTDLVFDGKKGHYLEDDTTNPVNYYGLTKLKGEQEVASVSNDHAIARVSVLYDWDPFEHTTNYISWVYKNLDKGKPLSLFSDQFRNATYIKNACEALLRIFEKDEKGIFHVAGKHCENRYDMGLKVAEIFNFDDSMISKMDSNESDWVAKRPKKCCLDVGKMESVLGVPAMTIEEGLLAMKKDLTYNQNRNLP
jgi:dTDP-4-dehydrorhamnose reductase